MAMIVIPLQTTIYQFSRICVICVALLSVAFTGCQQTVSSQANNGLFPRLFGRSTAQTQSYDGRPSFSSTSAWGQGSSFPASPASNSAGSSSRSINPFSQTSSRGSGITGNPLGPGGSPDLQYQAQAQAFQANQLQQQYSDELAGYNKRLSAYDADNQLLNTEVAALQQKLQLANQYSQTLRDQLADTSQRVQQSDFQRKSALEQLASAQQQIQTVGARAANAEQAREQSQAQLIGYRDRDNSSPTRLAGATLRANNSLLEHFASIQIPGGEARMDGDVIRIEIPSDNLFVPGTYQIQPARQPMLQNLAATIRQRFPQQIVGVEAHWDNTPLTPSTTTDHQLTATQALAMFDFFVRIGLPRNQLFTMAMASNRPRHRPGLVNGVSPNRRIEFVIYPETYDGR